jgi:hypothetical protein
MTRNATAERPIGDEPRQDTSGDAPGDGHDDDSGQESADGPGEDAEYADSGALPVRTAREPDGERCHEQEGRDVTGETEGDRSGVHTLSTVVRGIYSSFNRSSGTDWI